jgi:hypothetical protein
LVSWLLIPSLPVKAAHTAEVNCGPLSDVIRWRTLNLDTHPSMRAATQLSAVVERSGIAEAQHIERSTTRKSWE